MTRPLKSRSKDLRTRVFGTAGRKGPPCRKVRGADYRRGPSPVRTSTKIGFE